MREKLTSGFGNNNGADQAAQMPSLVSTFIIRSLESIISTYTTLAKFQFSSYFLYIAEQAGLGMTWSETRKTGFLTKRPV